MRVFIEELPREESHSQEFTVDAVAPAFLAISFDPTHSTFAELIFIQNQIMYSGLFK